MYPQKPMEMPGRSGGLSVTLASDVGDRGAASVIMAYEQYMRIYENMVYENGFGHQPQVFPCMGAHVVWAYMCTQTYKIYIHIHVTHDKKTQRNKSRTGRVHTREARLLEMDGVWRNRSSRSSLAT